MASGTGLLKEVDVTPVIITTPYVADDVLFATTEIPNVFSMRSRDDSQPRNVALNSITMIDEDDEDALDIDLVFVRSNVTVNAAGVPYTGLTAAQLLEIVGFVNLELSADMLHDAINGKFYQKEGLAIQMQAAADTSSLFVFALNRVATPTFALATNLKFRFGFTQD